MKAYCYLGKDKFGFVEKTEPHIADPRDAVVRVTLSSICTSDLHIMHGLVPRARTGVTVGHEFVGVVEETGADVKSVKAGDRVAVNVETFCGECFFCRRGWVNNCTSPLGGWALGCRIDGAQAAYVRVPFADNGLTKIPDGVSDERALLVGDVLATGYWAADIADIGADDTALVVGGGPVGLCAAMCAALRAKRVVVCEADAGRREFAKRHYPQFTAISPEHAEEFCRGECAHGGADAVIEAAGTDASFALGWKCARPNATVVVAAMYDAPQVLPLPDMYGKNLVFKTGGVDGCKCAEELALIAEGKIDPAPLITHTFAFSDIEKAYELFASRADGVMKVALRSE